MAYHQTVAGSPLTAVRDTTYTKVFVGGLAWETQSDSLRRFFEQFGDILEAVVITDKNTGRSKGYGFVTFRDPEAARRACENPSPVIDGRRANCNLAALGRLRPPFSFGRVRPVIPLIGSVQNPRSPYVGNPSYHQPGGSYGYQPGFVYPPYGYTTYAPEYVYSQQYLHVYGVPGVPTTGPYSYGQLGHPTSGSHGYTSLQNYGVPGQHLVQFAGPNLNGPTTAPPIPTIQAPYPTGVGGPVPGQPQIIVTAHSPQFTSGSDQTAG
ncbi:RNA-binding protein 24-A-like isoform X2 [Punica granatum]|uniref:RNA-binding protein 24-A-like isoform X2 n=1 Tax=Punica granatum TaxID=22663 RepID=A0A6P8E3W5_PUNGR|nr:RNA-binding protein 24-A-like isoform X2 [Punica granatum]